VGQSNGCKKTKRCGSGISYGLNGHHLHLESRESLAVVLKSLEVSIVPDGLEWEVLIVDNNSKDDTRAVCESFIAGNPGGFGICSTGRKARLTL